MKQIAIIGSGPTALYTAHALLTQAIEPFSLHIYEAQDEAGKGMPYHPAWNSSTMLANIASIEIPPLYQSLVEWLQHQRPEQLDSWGISPADITPRHFFPRMVLGEYLHDQFLQLEAHARRLNIPFHVHTSHPVRDVAIHTDNIQLSIETPQGRMIHPQFSHVVMATGHSWPTEQEPHPGYFLSPWPMTTILERGYGPVGIRGTSLSAIDVLVSLASARGEFIPDAQGGLHYAPHPGTERFHVTLMSRKGLLPEADFYHPIPYLPLQYCSAAQVDALIAQQPDYLLDATFALFKRELAAADPAYAARIDLDDITMEDFCDQYFSERVAHDPFDWARKNLAEAQAHEANAYTVPWRYAILRMHETVGRIVPHLNAEDHRRFQRHFKPIFVDDYATVPHESIKRLLALHDAGKLSILRLGDSYRIDAESPACGALLHWRGQCLHYPIFVEAMGQEVLSADAFPFPTLREQGVVRNATAPHRLNFGPRTEIGGIALDNHFHPLSQRPMAAHLYCLGLPFMLSQFPFAQGITSSHEMGQLVAAEIFGLPDPAPKPIHHTETAQ